MTDHAPKDLRGSIVAKLRAMLELAPNKPWDDLSDFEVANLEALPDLLRVVEAMARLTPRHVPSGYSAFYRCDACLGQGESSDSVQHADDCGAVLACKLCGGAT